MGELPDPGSTVAVVWRGAAPGTAYGVLRGASDPALAVELTCAIPWSPGDAVMLVVSENGSRQLARARFVAVRGQVALFRLDQPFHRFDLRGQSRFPLTARVEVRSRLSMTRHPGVVIDMSTGGMAVEVTTKPTGKALDVAVQVGGYGATLPCETVGTGGDDGHAILHLKFVGLTASQLAFVRNVILDLETEVERLRFAS